MLDPTQRSGRPPQPAAGDKRRPGAAPALSRRDVVARFRARLTPDLSALVKRSPAVARQFLPDAMELVDFGGTEAPFEEGKLNRGIYGLERLYNDRAVLTPYFDCSAYCRYCFKKTRTLAGDGRKMTEDEIENAAAYIRSDPRIEIVLITGGDPLLDIPLLRRVLDTVVTIQHVRAIRVGTRNILFQPERLDNEVADLLASYNRLDEADLRRSKSLAVAFSLNHPDEITPAVARAVQRLVRRGVVVRGQVTLLKGVNDDAATLLDLYRLFAAIGIVPYYLYHCMPVVGAHHFRTSVQRGLDILSALAPSTGAAAPTYVYVTPVGKHRLGAGHALDHVEHDGRRYIRATTPYLARDFLQNTGKPALPPLHEIGRGGYIISHYLDGND
jgi:KamA family protein